jgi:hypothetical protein
MSEPSKYEEAAKAHFDAIGRPDDGNEMRAWIAGAEHASKEDAQTIKELREALTCALRHWSLCDHPNLHQEFRENARKLIEP